MSECSEIIDQQIAILILVINKTNAAGIQDKDLQLELFDQVNRERRTKFLHKNKVNGNGADIPATPKQRANMDKFNIPYAANITAKDASALITKSIEEGKK